jgi:hypothetical protein
MRNGITNLLSLPLLEEDGFTVSYQTSGEWIVTAPHGKEIIIHRKTNNVCHGFPYLNACSMAAVSMSQTICQHYEGFTKRKVLGTIAVRKAQAMTRHPSNAQFNKMVRYKTIKKCPTKPKHIVSNTG